MKRKIYYKVNHDQETQLFVTVKHLSNMLPSINVISYGIVTKLGQYLSTEFG